MRRIEASNPILGDPAFGGAGGYLAPDRDAFADGDSAGPISTTRSRGLPADRPGAKR